MSRKKVLFIIGTLQSGGVTKSLINLLNTFDCETYETHLLILCKEGDIHSKFIPKDVIIHHNDIIDNLHLGFSGIKNLLLQGHLFYALASCCRMLLSKINKSLAGKFLAWLMPQFTTIEFDLIVDYGGQQLLYYMVNKLSGRKKVSFFHSDYKKWDYYYSADQKYYPKVDKIFTISSVCQQSLIDYFPNEKEKIEIMENISSPNLIYQLSTQPIFTTNANYKLVSVGHISKDKGFDLAIKVANILKQKGYDFKWFFIGKIIDQSLVDIVQQEQLEDSIILEGIKSNPYPYISQADIFVHLSRFEGKSIALDEAKILCKPIVVTNFSTVHDQFEDKVNATITSFEPTQIAQDIEDLLQNTALQKQFSNYLKAHISNNTDQVEHLYTLLQ